MSAIAEVLIMDEKLAGFSKTVSTVIAAEKATLNNITDAHDALVNKYTVSTPINNGSRPKYRYSYM